jgi:excisionase family DNA binding protein
MALIKAGQLPKPVEPKPEFETLTPTEAAKHLKVGVRAVRKAIRQGKLAAFKVGCRNWRIRVVDLNKYIEDLIAEWSIRPSDDAKP